jgi:hypothetical protein
MVMKHAGTSFLLSISPTFFASSNPLFACRTVEGRNLMLPFLSLVIHIRLEFFFDQIVILNGDETCWKVISSLDFPDFLCIKQPVSRS